MSLGRLAVCFACYRRVDKISLGLNAVASNGVKQIGTVTLASYNGGDIIVVDGIGGTPSTIISSVDLATTTSALVTAINAVSGVTVTAVSATPSSGVITLTANTAGIGFSSSVIVNESGATPTLTMTSTMVTTTPKAVSNL